MRGILSHSSRLLRINGITPAHAGNTICEAEITLVVRDHPRTRGEYSSFFEKPLEVPGSPPHTRGIPNVGAFSKIKLGITPAHAGNTGYQRTPAHLGWDHPRTRGEYLAQSVVVVIYPGSPPHTRGIRKVNAQEIPNGGITPAHAGNTGFFSRWKIKSWDHPRTRGEYSRFR